LYASFRQCSAKRHQIGRGPHRIGAETRVYLPAGDGVFAATVVGARTTDGQKHFVYARAGTFLTAPMLKPDQKPLPRAASAERTVALALWLPESHSPLATPASKFSNPEGRTAPTGQGVPSRPVGANLFLEET
jgi:hypothetical protein